MLPDVAAVAIVMLSAILSQCTYRCVVLPDLSGCRRSSSALFCLNAPTGAWCSLTLSMASWRGSRAASQCTYRCVVLPDYMYHQAKEQLRESQCTYRCVVLPDTNRRPRGDRA